VKTPADWRKRRDHVLAQRPARHGELPPDSRKAPLDVKVESEETLARVVRKKITFAAEKGDRVPAYLLIPTGHKGKAPAVLCLHQTTAIARASRPASAARRTCTTPRTRRARLRHARPDYPNFGGYKIDVYAKGYASATMKGIWNTRGRWICSPRCPKWTARGSASSRHSLGGHNALFLAAFDERVKVTVSSCGFNSFLKYRKGNLADWSHKGYVAEDRHQLRQ